MLNINPRSSTPIYEQIQLGIKELIIRGALKNGDKMPSVRQLSSILTINPNTISKAYGELEKEDIEITTTIEQIKKLFDDSENRRWLKAFINLDEEKGGFDVFKYLKDTQDIKGVKEKLVIKESPIKVSYAYLNPEINKSGTCEKDWDEYLENFVPYDMLNKLTERDLS